MAIVAIPILPVQTTSGNPFTAFRLIEEATQTFKAGTIVALAADGGVQAWVPNTGAAGTFTTTPVAQSIVGVCYEAASNLASTGLGAPTPFSPITGLGAAIGTFGSVPNQASAKNIAHGAPLNDGRVGFYPCSPDLLFSATFGNAGAGATPANTDVGVCYGLTLDTAANFFYVDKSKATVGTNTVVQIVSLDLRDVPAAGTRVIFKFDPRFVNLLSV
jgi:hypothetical protein